MCFSFMDLIAHACRTRPLSEGTIIGSGTVSNESNDVGFACLTEKRFQEIADLGKPVTGWLRERDRVRMEVLQNGVSVFGAIEQTAVL
jgi:fumarylacetoacetate (FAA) hydrolase